MRKSPEYDALVENILDTDGELPGGEYNSIANALLVKKHEYLNGSKTDRALLKRTLNMWAHNVKTYKTFRQDLASGYNTSKFMNTWTDSPMGKSVMSFLRDEPRLVEKTCPNDANCSHKNELGVLLPNFKKLEEAKQTLKNLDSEYNRASTDLKIIYEQDYFNERDKLLNTINTSASEWTAISNIKNKIKLKDTATKDALKAMGNNFISQSTQANPGDNIQFNYPAAERQVAVNIVGKSTNKQSLVHDEIIDGRTFYNDFVDKIATNSYASLGLANESSSPLTKKNDDFDKNRANSNIRKDIIKIEEAKKIANEIIDNKDYSKILDKELTNYFVGFLRNQWNIGRKNRPNPTQKNEEVVKNINKPVQYKPGIITASIKK